MSEELNRAIRENEDRRAMIEMREGTPTRARDCQPWPCDLRVVRELTKEGE